MLSILKHKNYQAFFSTILLEVMGFPDGIGKGKRKCNIMKMFKKQSRGAGDLKTLSAAILDM